MAQNLQHTILKFKDDLHGGDTPIYNSITLEVSPWRTSKNPLHYEDDTWPLLRRNPLD